MTDYSCKKDNIWISIAKFNGKEDKYLFFDYSKGGGDLDVCSVEKIIKLLN